MLYIVDKYGILLNNPDVYRLRYRAKKQLGPPGGFEGLLMALRKWLGDDKGASLYYEHQDTRLWGVAVATSNMREMYARFPEVVQMDGTFKTNCHGYILYHVTCTDNHGHPHTSLLSFVSADTADHVSWVVKSFKHYHVEGVAALRTVLVDKDYKEINAWRKICPGVRVLLCQVHAARTVLQECRSRCRGVAKIVSDMFNMAMRTCSEDVYHKAISEIRRISPYFYRSYFYPNWIECRSLWATIDRSSDLLFGDHTTNKIESLNKVIKKWVNAHTQMGEGVDRLLTMVEDRLVDFKRNQADSYLYAPSYPQVNVHVQEVLSYLTSYAGGVVFRHWKRKNRTSKLKANGRVCLCRFYCNWQLPCVHILNAVVIGRITPSEAVAGSRWCALRPNTTDHRRITCANRRDENKVRISVNVPPRSRKPFSSVDKHCRSRQLMHDLHAQITELEDGKFDNVLRKVSKMLTYLKEGKLVDIVPLDSQTENDPEGDKENVQGLVMRSRRKQHFPLNDVPLCTVQTFSVTVGNHTDIRLGTGAEVLPSLRIEKTVRGKRRKRGIRPAPTSGELDDSSVVCALCLSVTPPSSSRHQVTEGWVECSQCVQWYHCHCLCVQPEDVPDDWGCPSCAEVVPSSSRN